MLVFTLLVACPHPPPVASAAATSTVATSAVAPPTSLVPPDGDAYAALVARAESGDASIDFRALRVAYLHSAAYDRTAVPDEATTAERQAMFGALDRKDWTNAHALAMHQASLVYVDLNAQMVLRQSTTGLGDAAGADRRRTIELGLLKSITDSGDGRACATGWEAVTVDEEYFVLAVIGLQVTEQALVRDPGPCDAMTGTDEKGGVHTVYFRIDEMMAAETRSFTP